MIPSMTVFSQGLPTHVARELRSIDLYHTAREQGAWVEARGPKLSEGPSPYSLRTQIMTLGTDVGYSARMLDKLRAHFDLCWPHL